MAMFANKETKKETENLSQVSTIIAKGTVIHGDIESSGNIRIEGKVIGNVKAKSKIALGDSGFIQGNILAVNAEIAGEVKGILEVSESVSIKPSGVINGDVIAQKLSVETGGTLNGTTKMGGTPAKEIHLSSEEKNPQPIPLVANAK